MANEGALASLNDEQAIARIASGTLSKHIAAEYGVTAFAVRKRLAKHPDYQEAIKSQAESFVEDATAEVFNLNAESDMVAIARARVKADTAFKWAAARDPERWGQRPAGNVTIDLGSALQMLSERIQGRSGNDASHQQSVIEAEATTAKV